MKLLQNIIGKNKYEISCTLFALLFFFPVMRNAVQSISLILFITVSFFFYYGNFKTRVKDTHTWKTYLLLTGFFWFSLITYIWTTNTSFFLNEVRPTIALALIPFIVLFFHPPINRKYQNVACFFFLLALLIYLILWFHYHVEGISFYQEIIAKEAPIRDLPIYEQFQYLKNHSYKTWVGGVAERGHELNGGNSFFTHSNYISSYYVFGVFLAIYLLKSGDKKIAKITAAIALPCFLAFLAYTSSKMNLLLLLAGMLLSFFYFLKAIKIKWRMVTLVLIAAGIFLYKNTLITTYNSLKQWTVFEETDKNMDGKALIDYKRATIYAFVMDELRHSWTFGIGLGDVQDYINRRLEETGQYTKGFDVAKKYNTHSQFLHFALVGGIVNLLLFIALFLYLFKLALQQKNYLLGFFVLVIIANCLFENYLCRIYGVFFFVIFAVLLPTYKKETASPLHTEK